MGDSEGPGSLVCCSPRGLKELDTTEQLHNNNKQKSSNKNKAEKGILSDVPEPHENNLGIFSFSLVT